MNKIGQSWEIQRLTVTLSDTFQDSSYKYIFIRVCEWRIIGLEYQLNHHVDFMKKRQWSMSFCSLHPSFQVWIKFSRVVGILFLWVLLVILNPFSLFCCSCSWEYCHLGLRAAFSCSRFHGFLLSPKCSQVSCIPLWVFFKFYFVLFCFVFSLPKMGKENSVQQFKDGWMEQTFIS